MNLLDFFKTYLLTRETPPSKATVKNYLADVRKFILWFEQSFERPFDPSIVTHKTIIRYKNEKLARIRRGQNMYSPTFSQSSVDRYLSSLRKFFTCLKDNGLTSSSPFDGLAGEDSGVADEYLLKAFKNYLINTNNSTLTIKNYIIDIRHFLDWVKAVTKGSPSYLVGAESLLGKIQAGLIEEYKNRLLDQAKLSPVSINRKLSAIRRYLNWAYDEGLIKDRPTVAQNILVTPAIQKIDQDISKDINDSQAALALDHWEVPESDQIKEGSYSRFPPLRLLQKISVLGSFLFDALLIAPVALSISKMQYLLWVISGKKIFESASKELLSSTHKDTLPVLTGDPLGKILGGVTNFKKSFYAPHQISTAGLPVHKKAWHHLRHTRPAWYQRYHSYPLVHYIHFGILIIFLSAIGFGLYRSYWLGPEKEAVLAAAVSPPRILSFQGRLTDSSDTPITANTTLRFAIYNSQTSSGSAMLWQESQNVTPDQDGIFSVILGSKSGIPQSVFGQNAALFLGITVGRDPELIPRQQIASVAYATNSELLQGMPAITQTNAGTTNVILALDSSGNMTIAGTASPTFQATGGAFTLSGTVLNLQTNAGTNSNVVIRPDGTGVIDMQKSLQNTTSNGSLVPGAVQVEDMFAVLSNNSGSAAVTVGQSGSGPIINASSSGGTKFVVYNEGSAFLASNLGINQLAPSSKLYVNSGADSTSVSLNTSASSVTALSLLTNGSQYAALSKNSNSDLEWTTSSGADYILSPSGNVGIGTSVPGSFLLQVAGNVGPNVDSSYSLGSSSLRWSNIFVNSITPASTLTIAGATSFSAGLTIPSGQSLTLAGLTTNGGVLYTNGSGVVAGTSSGSAGDCLISNGGSSGPAWASCTASGGTNWNVINGAIYPKLADTLDLLIGGNSTSSAKFAFINNASGTPTASISGNIVLNSAGSIQTTSRQTLTLGGSTTGNIEFKPGAAASSTLTLLGNGNVGIGNSNPGATLDITGTIRGSGLFSANGGLTIASGQNLTHSGFTASGGVLYTNGSGVVAQTGAGTALQCLLGGTTPTWGSCATGTTDQFWQNVNGSLTPNNQTTDFLIGSSATASADFGVLNVPGATSVTYVGGNLGIGTTAPGSRLDIFGTTSLGASKGVAQIYSNGNAGETNGLAVLSNDTGTSTPSFSLARALLSGLQVTPDGNTHNYGVWGHQYNNGIGGYGILGSFGTDPTSPLNWASLGGTNALVVSGSTNQKALALIQGDGTQDLFTASASGSTKFLIDKTGNVGIGTTAPTAQLHVDGSGTGLRVYNGATELVEISQNAGLQVRTTGIAAWTNLGTSNTSIPILQWYDSGNNALGRISADGNIGIGTTNPSSFNLQVNGSIGPDAAPTITTTTQATTSVDTTGDVGESKSIAIGTDGLPIISYWDVTNSDLKVLKCGNAACSSGNITTSVDTTNGVGQYSSIAIGTDGLPVISYFDVSNTDLKVVKCGNASCSSGNTLTTVDSTGFVGQYTSIAIGTDGLPVISYYDSTNADLKVAKCGNTSCSSGNTLTTVDSNNNRGFWTSIAVGPDGLPFVSYYDVTNDNLRVAKCLDAACTTSTQTNIDTTGDVGQYTSTAIGTDNRPIISYYDISNGNLKVVKCGAVDCSGGNTISGIDSGGVVGSYTSIAIGAEGLPIVSYYDTTNGDLKVVKCGNEDCDNGNITTTLDATGDVGIYTSIAIGTDGLPVITHHDQTNGDLKVVKCATPACSETSGAVYAGGSDIGSRSAFFKNVYAAQYWGRKFQIADFADVAENYNIDGMAIKGDIVRVKVGTLLMRTTQSYDEKAIGVISSNPGITLGSETGTTPVALAGRAPVNISSSSEPIEVGDPITTSDEEGKGMKATKAGMVIGVALEAWSPDDTDGQVLMFVNRGFQDPDVYITESGELNILHASPSGYMVKNGNETIDRIGAFAEAIIGTLKAGALNATRVSAESITIAGMSLREYILSIVAEAKNQPAIISPLDGKLAVNVLSPLGDPEISLNLAKDELSVKNKAGEKVAGIDNKGNATFSGTLKADRIETDDLSLSQDALSKLKDRLGASSSATTINNITNIYQTTATPSATPTSTPSPSQTASVSATPTPTLPTVQPETQNSIQSEYIDIASMSGVLGYVPNLRSDFGTFREGLISLGPASLNDVSVAGQLRIAGNMIISENSINVIGADFEIQPLRQGNVSFMGGLVKIDIDGNLSVGGNATFAKNVSIKGLFETNFVSPIPGNDLVINLPHTPGLSPEAASSLVIQNASGSGVLRINQQGDVISSGSGQFKILTAEGFKIVRGAQADTSLTETIATASAGTAIISRNQTERTVLSPFVKEDSLIYITPTSDTAGLTPYIARQTPENKESGIKGSFTIQVPQLTTKDIKVNWWVVN